MKRKLDNIVQVAVPEERETTKNKISKPKVQSISWCHLTWPESPPPFAVEPEQLKVRKRMHVSKLESPITVSLAGSYKYCGWKVSLSTWSRVRLSMHGHIHMHSAKSWVMSVLHFQTGPSMESKEIPQPSPGQSSSGACIAICIALSTLHILGHLAKKCQNICIWPEHVAAAKPRPFPST